MVTPLAARARDLAFFAICAVVILALRLTPWAGQLPVENAQAVLVVAVAMVAFSRLRQGKKLRLLYRSVLLGCAGLFVAVYVHRLIGLIGAPPMEWDFLAFYLDGYVARTADTLYDPEGYSVAVRTLRDEMDSLGIVLSDGFRREVVEVGFKSPPFSAYVLMWMSALPIETAHFIWRFVVAASLAAYCILLTGLRRRPVPGSVSSGFIDHFALTLVVVLSMRGSSAVLLFGQTSAFVAVFLLLAVLCVRHPHAGLWAALAVIFKPLAAIAFPFFLIARYWRQSALMASAIVVAIMASLATFGLDDWQNYSMQEFARTSPAWLYFQDNTTSMLAEIMRWNDVQDYPWARPDVMLTNNIATIVTLSWGAYLAFRYGRAQSRLAFSTMIVVGLVVYPGTQVSYGLIGAIPMLAIASEMARRSYRDIWVGAFVCISIGLLNWVPLTSWALMLCLATVLLHSPYSTDAEGSWAKDWRDAGRSGLVNSI